MNSPYTTEDGHIMPREPLSWLVALIFTDQFFIRHASQEPDLIIRDLASPMEIYAYAESYVDENPDAKECLEAARKAVEEGKIGFYPTVEDEWGEKPSHEPESKVDTYDFLIWAENEGYQLPQRILKHAEHLVHRSIHQKEANERQEYLFPPITREQFERLRKEPLWKVRKGILYLLGRRQRGDDLNVHYEGQDFMAKKLRKYVADAYRAGDLKLIDCRDERVLESRVSPAHFIEWAKHLPVKLPMLQTDTVEQRTSLPSNLTPEMRLMLDAAEHFWSERGYANLSENDRLKKLITSWLQEEAEKRGMELSKNLAEAMDTIIRPQSERRGGNKAINS